MKHFGGINIDLKIDKPSQFISGTLDISFDLGRFVCIYGRDPNVNDVIIDIDHELPSLVFQNTGDADEWLNYLRNKEDKKMRNDPFVVKLRSYDEKNSRVLTTIDIETKNFKTLKKIVDFIQPLLEEEDVKKDC